MAPVRRAATRFLARHRRGVAALCLGLAMLSLGLALRPPALQTVTVPVAARSLPTGHRLEAADLAMTNVATAIAPSDHSGTAAELTGRVLAAPVIAGEPIAAARLMGPVVGAWAGAEGTAPLPVRFADAGAVDLIDAGQHLDVLAAQGSDLGDGATRAQVVARDVMVLAVVRSVEASEDGLLGSGPSPPGGDAAGRSDLVILAASEPQALAIAAAEAGSRLTFRMLRGG